MKVIIAHPGKQHSFQTSTAINMSEDLMCYITTIYAKEGSLTDFINKHILTGDAQKKGKGRRCQQLRDEQVVQFCEFRSLLNLFASKLKLPKWFKGWMNDSMADSFSRKVAKYVIKNNADAVIMYDCTSNECFKILESKAPHIKRILDVSISHRGFLKKTYEEDIKIYGDNGLQKEQAFLWNSKNMYRYVSETKYPHYFFVPSQVVKRSLLEQGVNEAQILVIPYGVDCSKFDYIQKREHSKPLNLVFVGQVNHRKGIHHLLRVMDRFKPDEVTLKMAGSYDENSELYQNYKNKKNIEFCGFITRDNLAELYQNSDVFVFPTIGEGFGLVVLEALSCGLPIIITNLAGGNDAIQTGINGIEYNALSEDELEESIRYFIKNPGTLPAMSAEARRTAEKYTWDNYYKNIQSAVNEIVKETK